ncbi:MAG: hypothetical protein KC449_12045 [Anaerolineales bacterium]|nr:hypothetical protein [Anaerolineales bacterium]
MILMQNARLVTLANKLEIHFSLKEIKHICFELGVEYENLEGSETLRDKSRELVLFMERRGEFNQLEKKVKEARPRVDFREEVTVSNVTKALPEAKKRELAFLFDEWTSTNQELIYLKTLHNELDVLINNVFDLFDTKVTSLHNKRLQEENVRELKERWMEVEIRLEMLLEQAAHGRVKTNIQRYSIFQANQKQFKTLDTMYKEISLHLEQLEPSSVKRIWHRKGTPVILPPGFTSWSRWWWNFSELNRKLKRSIKSNMSLTDRRLRETADRLYKQTERIRGEKEI